MQLRESEAELEPGQRCEVIMRDLFRSELEMHNNSERTDLLALVDTELRIVGAASGVDQSSLNSTALSIGQIRAAQSKGSLTHHQEVPNRKTARIAMQSKGRILLFDAVELIAVEAQGNYVLLQRQTCSHLFRRSISKIEETLGPYGFVRIHRSVLINSAHVEEVQSLFTGEHQVCIRSGKRYNVGRRYIANLRLLAEAWIDMES
jgi:DNA-binding LytR/AlgR family response regulator